MKVDSSVLLAGKAEEGTELWFAQCALISEVALLANDRTEAGEKNTTAGVVYTDSTLFNLGFKNVWRFRHEGEEVEIEYAKKKVKCKPTVEVLMAWNDTDCVITFRGTCNQNGWDINIWKAGLTRTDIGDCHQGWFEDMDFAYDSLVEKLNSIKGIKAMRLWVGGHSKGSSESQDFAVAINRLFPFEMFLGIGSPMPFGTETAKYHTKIFIGRMYVTKNNNDIVCDMPPLGYGVCGKMIYIDSDGNVTIGLPWWKRALDGIAGWFKKNPGQGEEQTYPEPAEDHHPCYYCNAFLKAAGETRRYKRWEQKYMQ